MEPTTNEEEDALKVLDNPLSTPAQRTDARIILGMSKTEAMKMEEKEEDASLKAWEEASGWYNEEYDGADKRALEQICGKEQEPIPGKPYWYRSKGGPNLREGDRG